MVSTTNKRMDICHAKTECFMKAQVWVVFEKDGEIRPMCFSCWNKWWSNRISEIYKWQDFDSLEDAMVGRFMVE